MVAFLKHLCDVPEEEIVNIELPEPPKDSQKTLFWELEVCLALIYVTISSYPCYCRKEIYLSGVEKLRLNSPRGGYIIGKISAKKSSVTVKGKRTRTKNPKYKN